MTPRGFGGFAAVCTAAEVLLLAAAALAGGEHAAAGASLRAAAAFGASVPALCAAFAGGAGAPATAALGLAAVGLSAAGGLPAGAAAAAAALLVGGSWSADRIRRAFESAGRGLQESVEAADERAAGREKENEGTSLRIRAVEEALGRTPVLVSLCERLLSATGPADAAERVVDAALALCPGAELAALAETADGRLRPLVVRGRGEGLRDGPSSPFGDEVDRSVLERMAPVLLSEVAGAGPARSVACTPLLDESEGAAGAAACRGLLRIQSARPGSIRRDDLEVLNILASLAAVSLESARLLQSAEALAIQDGLTGLYTMRYFRERFPEEISRVSRAGQAAAVLLFDLDRFKAVNDTRGHLAGDEALQRFARILQTYQHRGYLAARYGGDEFVLLLPERAEGHARAAAEDIRARAEEALRDHGVTASGGIAFHPRDGRDQEGLLKKADEALYRAKRAGRNRVEESIP